MVLTHLLCYHERKCDSSTCVTANLFSGVVVPAQSCTVYPVKIFCPYGVHPKDFSPHTVEAYSNVDNSTWYSYAHTALLCYHHYPANKNRCCWVQQVGFKIAQSIKHIGWYVWCNQTYWLIDDIRSWLLTLFRRYLALSELMLRTSKLPYDEFVFMNVYDLYDIM